MAVNSSGKKNLKYIKLWLFNLSLRCQSYHNEHDANPESVSQQKSMSENRWLMVFDDIHMFLLIQNI